MFTMLFLCQGYCIAYFCLVCLYRISASSRVGYEFCFIFRFLYYLSQCVSLEPVLYVFVMLWRIVNPNVVDSLYYKLGKDIRVNITLINANVGFYIATADFRWEAA